MTRNEEKMVRRLILAVRGGGQHELDSATLAIEFYMGMRGKKSKTGDGKWPKLT